MVFDMMFATLCYYIDCICIYKEKNSEWVIKFNSLLWDSGHVVHEVRVVHISHVIITFTLEK